MLVLLGIVLLISLVGSNCPNSQICDCTSDYINCTCLQRDTIIFTAKDIDEKDVFSGKEFIVNGCGRIILKKFSLKEYDLESVHISDVLNLEIESFAFYEAMITNIHISNIEAFKLEAQGFSNIEAVTNLTIKNVTLSKLDKSLFSDTTVPHFIIKDSNIGTIEIASLQMDNCESISIENNTIRTITVGSIVIKDVKKFSFIRNSVETTHADSFTFTSVKEIDFGYSRFREVASNMILAKQIELLSFHNNYIRTCEDKAFYGIQLTKQVNFFENQILVAKPDSLIPNHNTNEQNSTIIMNEDNEIGCDCNIEWLLSADSEKYNSIKEKNVCHHPPHLKGLSLSLLKIFMDKDGNCSIDTVTSTEAPVTTILTTTEPEQEFITEQSTTNSTQRKIAHYVEPVNEQPTNGQQVSCQDKQKTNVNSGNKYQCNVILLFASFTILISRRFV